MADVIKPYRVLARKYRPQNFDELVGQDSLVRTLKNAITMGRIAHAFMLTGVRGVGKTTTARIIAKALNYTGADGLAQPTIGATDDCQICRAIAEDRHPDVLEMDAASRTGVDDIREILDGLRYAPTQARYKVYIIDEVHMLSKNAFNALLKTLEEPPAHVKFIFATTEIRKVPVTVLSRCQRFDLQRVSVDALSTHYADICGREAVAAEPEALRLIAQAADGSVRDGLSLLDQAIALSGDAITSEQVREMLGLTEKSQIFDILEAILSGDIARALKLCESLRLSGGAALTMVQDLMALTHLLSKIRAVPDIKGLEQFHSSDELLRARAMAQKISMPVLNKTWQLLLKGLGEVGEAPNPFSALEMVLIRLAYAAELPDPSDLMRKLKDMSAKDVKSQEKGYQAIPSGGGGASAMMMAAPRYDVMPEMAPQTQPSADIKTLSDVIALLEAHQELLLASQLYHFAHLVRLEFVNAPENGLWHLEFRIGANASPRLSQELGQVLRRITGQRWIVSVVNHGGAQTLAQDAEAARQNELSQAAAHPLVDNILKLFPEAQLVKILKTDNNNTHIIEKD